MIHHFYLLIPIHTGYDGLLVWLQTFKETIHRVVVKHEKADLFETS